MIEINKLIRSKRRTLSLIVEIDGTLTVRAPLRMKEADIRRFIEAKKSWVNGSRPGRRKKRNSPSSIYGRRNVPVPGQEIPLRIVSPNKKPALVMDRFFKLAESARSQAQSVFEAWYKKQARALLTERVEFFAHAQGFKVKKIRISSARTRWGSCSAKGTLSFTWRLVMAPPDVIDYVVVHELCHLKELNHSKAFWAQVEAILPDYKTRRKWLKDNGAKLHL